MPSRWSCPEGEHDWEELPPSAWPWIACCRVCGLPLVEGEEGMMRREESEMEASDATG